MGCRACNSLGTPERSRRCSRVARQRHLVQMLLHCLWHLQWPHSKTVRLSVHHPRSCTKARRNHFTGWRESLLSFPKSKVILQRSCPRGRQRNPSQQWPTRRELVRRKTNRLERMQKRIHLQKQQRLQKARQSRRQSRSLTKPTLLKN